MGKWIVDRTGEFRLSLAEGNKCGIEGTHGFTYEFKLEGNALDARQFLVDHHEVDEAIQKWAAKHTFRGSCEQVAAAIGNIVLDHVDPVVFENLVRLTTLITGSKVGSITYRTTPAEYRTFAPVLEQLPRVKRR